MPVSVSSCSFIALSIRLLSLFLDFDFFSFLCFFLLSFLCFFFFFLCSTSSHGNNDDDDDDVTLFAASLSGFKCIVFSFFACATINESRLARFQNNVHKRLEFSTC